MGQNFEIRVDALMPAEMAAKAEDIGIRKVNLDFMTTFSLAVLAGAFIAIGAIFATLVVTGAGEKLSYGVTRLLAGLVFSLGLILVIVAGAELFTGNNLIVMAWASRRISTAALLRNWVIVYAGNFVGSILTVILSLASKQYLQAGGEVGLTAINIANAKVQFTFIQALALGILANALVCLAVWLTYSARSTTDRILAIVPPITAFVAAGYEHSIANMYFIPMGLVIKDFAPASYWQAIGKTAADFSSLTWGRFLVSNLIPVTLGNIIGGALMVGAVYWFVYLHRARLT
jgi:formate transporter